MALETGTYISDLVATNPPGGDPVSQADDHLRLVKSTIKATFPNINAAVTATPAQLNRVTGSNYLIVDRAYAEYTANASLTTIIPLDDTIPQNTEGTQILSVSITPKNITNRLRISFQGNATSTATPIAVICALFSSASANAIAASIISVPTLDYSETLTMVYEYVPATTSALTFTVRVGPSSAASVRLNGNTVGRFFGGASRATLVVDEIAV